MFLKIADLLVDFVDFIGVNKSTEVAHHVLMQ